LRATSGGKWYGCRVSDVERIEFQGAGGLRLVADTAGPRNADPVILLHGGGQTRFAWRRALEDVAEHGWRAIALDSRGHGDSAWSTDGHYSVDSLCGDLRAVISTLEAKPVLVGASLGGNVAMITEGETPGSARALVLVDVAPRLESAGVQRIIDFMTARPDGFATLDEAADAVAAYNPSRARPEGNQGLAKNLRLGDDGRWRWHWDPCFMQMDAAHRGARVAELRQRMEAAVSCVGIPTLLIRGAQSDVVSLDAVKALQAQIPHLETTDVSGAGHMVAGDRNDHFNAALLGFLDRLGDGYPRQAQ
jgi:pimeloyl-ACP methyl ester carboxylesterase